MLRATRIRPKGTWSEPPADRVVLDETGRHRRRVRMCGENGLEFLLDLPEARLLRQGDGLVLEDGRIVAVEAEPEELYAVYATDKTHLLRLAWHIGNRHLAAHISAERILIRRDHVIRDMLIGLGARVQEIRAPFDPEGGAYDGHQHEPDHRHG